jgi:hypothetical protein
MGANSSIPAKYDTPAYAILSLELGLTTIAVGGRIASRRVMNAPLKADDYMAYMAYVGFFFLFGIPWKKLMC